MRTLLAILVVCSFSSAAFAAGVSYDFTAGDALDTVNAPALGTVPTNRDTNGDGVVDSEDLALVTMALTGNDTLDEGSAEQVLAQPVSRQTGEVAFLQHSIFSDVATGNSERYKQITSLQMDGVSVLELIHSFHTKDIGEKQLRYRFNGHYSGDWYASIYSHAMWHGAATVEDLNGIHDITIVARPVSASESELEIVAPNATAEMTIRRAMPDQFNRVSATGYHDLVRSHSIYADGASSANAHVGLTRLRGGFAASTDFNLDFDTNISQADGNGDAEILLANLGMTEGAMLIDGDANNDGDVDVFQLDGQGDAQLLVENLPAAVAAGEAVMIYDRVTGEVTFDVGEGMDVVRFEVADGLRRNVGSAGALLGNEPGRDDEVVLAYFEPRGMPAGTESVGMVLVPGLTPEQIGFKYTPIGGFTTQGVVKVVPEPASLALLTLGGFVIFRRQRRAWSCAGGPDAE